VIIMDDNIRKHLEERLAAPPLPPLERARKFLTFFIHDYDPALLEFEAKDSPAAVSDGVAAIEELLTRPPPPGTLYQIVTHEGNRMLEEETDAAAASWLRGLMQQLRVWLGENAPPPMGS
jgi:hypothetical protein